MKLRIHFIGTVHGDPLGLERLQKALDCERPTIITLECSEELVSYLQDEAIPAIHEKIDSLDFSHNEVEFLKKEFSKLNFEIVASRAYVLQHSIPLHYVDHPSSKKIAQREVAQFCRLSADDMRTFLTTSPLDRKIVGTDAIYKRYQKLFEQFDEEEQKIVNREAHNFTYRDSFMAENLEGIVTPGARLVHVGGIGHCLKDTEGRTLFSKLRQYNPTRETLKWYDGK